MKVYSSLYLIDTVEPVIADPPLSVTVQLMMTLSGLHVVSGAGGVPGFCAAKTLIVCD